MMTRLRLSGRGNRGSQAQRPLTVLDVIDDRAFFRNHFRDPKSWSAWRTFLAVLFGLPIDNKQRELFQQCTARQQPNPNGYHEAHLVVGRRGGKSFVLALIAVYLAAFKSWLEYLGPGERATIMIVAADRKQSRVITRYCKGLLNGTPMLRDLIENERAESIDLTNRVSIEVHTASYRTTRGYTIVAALLDELAFWSVDENAAEPDVEVLNALRPGMATIPDAMLLCASSPYARRGALWTAYHKHFGKDDSAALVWQAATRTMNPSIPQAVIDEAMEQDPASAQAEYLAQFRSDIESFISREIVEACISQNVYERPPREGLRYVAATDPSGGASDSFTLSIAHRDGDSLLSDLIREVRPPFSPQSVIEEFAQTLKAYNIRTVIGDRYAGEFPREIFRRYGITYELSSKNKSDIYLNALPLLTSRRAQLLDNARLTAQLIGLERRTARSGRDSIDHGPGGHDDVANAVLAALLAAATPAQRLRMGSYFLTGGKLGFEIDVKTGRPILPADPYREPLRGDHGCVPGKGIDASVSLFNAQLGIIQPAKR